MNNKPMTNDHLVQFADLLKIVAVTYPHIHKAIVDRDLETLDRWEIQCAEFYAVNGKDAVFSLSMFR